MYPWRYNAPCKLATLGTKLASRIFCSPVLNVILVQGPTPSLPKTLSSAKLPPTLTASIAPW